MWCLKWRVGVVVDYDRDLCGGLGVEDLEGNSDKNGMNESFRDTKSRYYEKGSKVKEGFNAWTSIKQSLCIAQLMKYLT